MKPDEKSGSTESAPKMSKPEWDAQPGRVVKEMQEQGAPGGRIPPANRCSAHFGTQSLEFKCGALALGARFFERALCPFSV